MMLPDTFEQFIRNNPKLATQYLGDRINQDSFLHNLKATLESFYLGDWEDRETTNGFTISQLDKFSEINQLSVSQVLHCDVALR